MISTHDSDAQLGAETSKIIIEVNINFTLTFAYRVIATTRGESSCNFT